MRNNDSNNINENNVDEKALNNTQIENSEDTTDENFVVETKEVVVEDKLEEPVVEPVDTEITEEKKEEVKEIVIKFKKPDLKDKKIKKIIIGAVAAIVVLFGIIIGSSTMSKNNYKDNLSEAISLMYQGAYAAEQAGGLIHDVWYNTIYEKADPETNYYTLKSSYREKYKNSTYVSDYYFNDDFNDSLRNLFSDATFQLKIRTIESYQDDVADLMKKLIDVPDGMEAAYSAIEDLYDQFQGLTRCATDPQGSLTSYTSEFNKYDNGFVDAYKKATLYQD